MVYRGIILPCLFPWGAPHQRIYDGGGIKEESWRGNYEAGTLEEESWRRKHGGGIVEEESWKRSHGGGIMEEYKY